MTQEAASVWTGGAHGTKTAVAGISMAKPRILIIEDERALTKVLTYNLEREGYETIVAHDGQEGLRKAQTQPIDLILLDLMLPTLGGLEICRELRAGESTRDVPIMMMTARAEETDQIVGFSMGADDYVTKPFSNKVLLERIGAYAARGSASRGATSSSMPASRSTGSATRRA